MERGTRKRPGDTTAAHRAGSEAQHAARLSDERPFSGGAATIENDSIAAHIIKAGVSTGYGWVTPAKCTNPRT